jgi:hypothetical protein
VSISICFDALQHLVKLDGEWCTSTSTKLSEEVPGCLNVEGMVVVVVLHSNVLLVLASLMGHFALLVAKEHVGFLLRLPIEELSHGEG